MRMKTADLTGAALDIAVAFALGYKMILLRRGRGRKRISCICELEGGGAIAYADFSPSTNWEQGGPLIESGLISTLYHPEDSPNSAGFWRAWFRFDSPVFEDKSQLVAACRAIVQSSLGDEVEVPDDIGATK